MRPDRERRPPSAIRGVQHRPPRPPSEGRLVLLLAFLSVLLTGGLVVGAGQYGDRIVDVERSRRIMRAEQMLDQTLQAVSAYSFERVAELDGEAIFEAGDPAESGMRIELEVKPASADTLRIDAVLRDARTSEIVRRIVTYRGRS